MKIKNFLLIVIWSLIQVATVYSQSAPKYIFLFIGDGMGLNQVFLTEKYLSEEKGDPLVFLNNNWTFGLTKTDCKDSFKITDSGAAGTAIACGEKTKYGYIGNDKNNQPLQSIAAALYKKKFKIGIITSVSLNHATPAGFYAHQPTRKNYDFITKDLINSKYDFFAGGGFRMGNADPTKKIYNSFNEIITELTSNKVNVILNFSAIKNEKISLPALIVDTTILNLQKNWKNSVIDECYAFPYAIDYPEYKEMLANYTASAIQNLTNDNGFFIMVEGGKIDWACHDNDAATAIHEISSFNMAINKAVEFYLKNPKNTLIIVTSDHETGGMTLGKGYNESSSNKNYYALYPQILAKQKKSRLFSDSTFITKYNEDAQIGWTTSDHTASPVGIWTIGKGSEKFVGIFENAEIKKKILELVFP